MKVWFFNVEERLKDRLKIAAAWRSTAKRAEHIFPDGQSGPNSDTCPSTFSIRLPHFGNDTNLFKKQARTFPGETFSCPSKRGILTRAAPADDIHRGQFGPVQLGYVPHMDHVGEVFLGHADGKRLDLAGPNGDDPVPYRSQGKAADPVE